ncbi:MAG: hypothetical protein JXR96_18045 [Deltaproteobacteria bacterium]|nr:hypothetical protein [Deltaproteobacteria bacterium]
MPRHPAFLGSTCLLLACLPLACATAPQGPPPLPGQEPVLCLARAGLCPGAALADAAQARIGAAERELGRSTGPALSIEPAGEPAEKDPIEQASLLGQQRGAAAVLLERPGGGWRVLPIAPTLSRLLAGPFEPLDRGPVEADLAAAVLAARADQALAAVDEEGARRIARAALGALAADYACAGTGRLRYLIWYAGASDDRDEAMQSLRSSCLEARVEGEREQELKTFLALLTELESARGSGWSWDELPEAWQEDRARTSALGQMRARAAALHGPRAQLVAALLDELDASLLEPADACDEQTLARQEAELDRTAQELVRLGRRDLCSRHLGDWLDEEGRLKQDTLQRFRADAYLPEHRWLLSENLATALLVMSTTAADPKLSAPLCKDYFAEIERQVAQDRWPDALDRHIDRLTSAIFSGAGACQDRAPLQRLLREILAQAAADERGCIGVLEVLASMGVNLFTSLFSGQQHRVLVTLIELRDALQHELGKLGQSHDDQALAAVIKTLLAIEPFMKGDVQAGLEMLAGAEKTLGSLPFPPRETDPLLVRIAPGLHLLSLYILGGTHALLDQIPQAAGVLSRLPPLFDRNIPLAMHALDAGAHSAAAVRAVKGLHAILEMLLWPEGVMSEDRLAAVREHVLQARLRLGDRGDWWDIGLGVGGVVLVDMLALIHGDRLGEKERERLLGLARADLGQVADRALAWFATQPDQWEALRLLPALHRTAERYFLGAESDDTGGKLWSALQASEPELAAVLGAITRKRPYAERAAALAKDGGLSGLLLELAQAAHGAGLDALRERRPSALSGLTGQLDILDRALEHEQRHTLRMHLGLLACVTLFYLDQHSAAYGWLQRASRAALHTRMARHVHYIDVLGVAFRELAGERAAALEVLADIIKRGDRALGCEKFHEVHALLPQLARLAESEGDHARAMRAQQTFQSLVERGFAAESEIETIYSYERGAFVLNVTLKRKLGSCLESFAQESSFQVGMGAKSQDTNRERLKVKGGLVFGVRYDRVLNGQLQQAFFALLHGEDAAAERALGRALETAMRLRHGHLATLGLQRAGGLTDAREHAYPPPLFWTGVLAQLRGHGYLGAELESCARALASEKGGSDPFALHEAFPPAYLGEFACREGLRDLLRAWQAQSPALQGWDEKLRQAARSFSKQHPEIVPAWGPPLAEARHDFQLGRFAETHERLDAMSAEQRALACAASLSALLLGVEKGRWPAKAVLAEVLSDLGGQGFAAEAAYLARSAALAGAPEAETGVEAAIRALAARPADSIVSLLRGELHLVLAQRAFQAGRVEQGLADLIRSLKERNGRFPLQEQIQQESAAVRIAIQAGDLATARQRIAAYLPVLTRVQGWQDPSVFRLQAVDLALAVLAGAPPQAEASRELLERGSEIEGVDAAKRFLKALGEQLSSGTDTKSLCREFLAEMQLSG